MSNSSNSSVSSGGKIINQILLKRIDSNEDSNYIVVSILKMIKQLKKLPHRNLSLYEFLDLLRDMVYTDVNLSLMDDFNDIFKIHPKNHYLHYYIYFLNYAAYYHLIRSENKNIDIEHIDRHKIQMIKIKEQINFIYNIIKNIKSKEDILYPYHSTEISL